MAVQPYENGGWSLSEIGLRIRDPDLPYEQFERLCSTLGGIHAAVRFAIGDAMIQGEALYGEQAYQAFELLNLSEAGRQEYVRVSQRVPPSTRRKGLSWSHHRAVAALEPPEQKAWLRKAAEEDMSHHALREALRGPDVPATRCRCCGREYG